MTAPEESHNPQRQQRNQRRHQNRKPRQQGGDNKNTQADRQGGTQTRRDSSHKHKHQQQQQKHKNKQNNNQNQQQSQGRAFVPVGEPESITGLLEITTKGFGFIRTADNDWAPSDAAIYVPADIIAELRLRPFVQLTGMAQRYERGHQLISVQIGRAHV